MAATTKRLARTQVCLRHGLLNSAIANANPASLTVRAWYIPLDHDEMAEPLTFEVERRAAHATLASARGFSIDQSA